MLQMVERKVRSQAQQLYEKCGQTEGQDLQDWFQAESEVLENSILAPLYRRVKNGQAAEPEATEVVG
jgi:regulation of enolase protein 1 (concanavalin A-like superfamily)